jgi:hypothetical protein
MTDGRLTRWTWAGLAAFAWFFGWMLLLGALRPDYHQATKAVSELGAIGAPYMLLMNACGFVGTGLLLALFAHGYRSRLGRGAPGSTALVVTAVLFALTAVPLEIGADGNPDMASGMTQVHLVFVLLAPLPWLWAATRISWLGRRGPRVGLALASGLAAAGLVVITALSFAQALPEAPGLLQRASFVVFLGWYAVAALLLGNEERPVQA